MGLRLLKARAAGVSEGGRCGGKMDPDELWSMRNNFYVGCYQGCLEEGEMARLDDKPALVAQRDAFAARSKLALGDFRAVYGLVGAQPATLELKAVREAAVVLDPATPAEAVSAALARIKSMVDQDASGNETLRVMAGTAFAHVGDVNESLRALRAGPGSSSLEALHMQAMTYVRMDRPDAAKRVLEMMQQKDEDSTLTQLASAWVALASASTGGETSVREARYVFEELIGKWQPTPLLVGGLAAALMHQGNAAEALKQLDEVAKQYPDDASVAFDRIVASELVGKPVDEAVESLRRVAPKHPYFQDLAKVSAVFDQSAKGFKASA